MWPKVHFEDLGIISYKDALEHQLVVHNKLIERKVGIRKGIIKPTEIKLEHNLIFCQHKPVYTLGKSGSLSHLLLNKKELTLKGIEFYRTNRGGDITYHGLGQLVGYPIFDLDDFFNDVHKYVRLLEEVIIQSMEVFSIKTTRIKGLTGVWIKGNSREKDRKICAIGIHMSRWVTLHGFALNINTDLDYFSGIVPCGISNKDKDVTSMELELKKEIDIEQVKSVVKRKFKEVFTFDYI